MKLLKPWGPEGSWDSWAGDLICPQHDVTMCEACGARFVGEEAEEYWLATISDYDCDQLPKEKEGLILFEVTSCTFDVVG